MVMTQRHNPDELLSFPCHYEFKAFAAVTGDDVFSPAVLAAVSAVVPVGSDAMRIRLSSARRYQCVTVLVRLENSSQLTGIYANLRAVDGLRYLL